MDIASLLGLTMLCLGSALAALLLFSWIDRRNKTPKPSAKDQVFFLFDRNGMVHASDQAREILQEAGSGGTEDWPSVQRALRLRFPDLPKNSDAAFAMAPAQLPANRDKDPAKLSLDIRHDLLRLTLIDPHAPTNADRHLRIRHGRMLRRMDLATRLYPNPLWLLASDGSLEWANVAYYKFRDSISSNTDDGKIESFEFDLDNGVRAASKRIMLQTNEKDAPTWFNVIKTAANDGVSLNFASNIDEVINAEIAQRKFVQTLTKTFAQLSAGLAIFNRDRELALFNPALIDLFGLSAEFLSSRPTLVSFFDRLRDTQMMPEPKDYQNWRQQITDLVIASVDGRFQETWTLPSGLTYRVTGRPHPDGAIALLFEDISAEISLTRRFRSEINLGQSIIDTLDEAIVVFSVNGTVTTSNKPYRELWRLDPDSSFADTSIRDALRQWQSVAGASPLWQKLGEYLGDQGDRSEWFADVTMKDGAQLECRVAPLAGGATLVGFRLRPVLPTVRPKHRQGNEPG